MTTDVCVSTRTFPTTFGFQVTSGFAVSDARSALPGVLRKGSPARIAVVADRTPEPVKSILKQPVDQEVGWQGLFQISNTSGAAGVLGVKAQEDTLGESGYKIEICCTTHTGPGVKRMVKSVIRGLKACQEPEKAADGMGGTYFFMNENGRKTAILKPCDEEPLAPNNPKGYVGRSLGDPGWKPTVRVGEAAMREVAAFLLDHEGFSRVPCTVLVRARHPIFHYEGTRAQLRQSCADFDDLVSEQSVNPLKLGSLQEFVHHECDTSEMGPSRFSAKDVHRIAILDLRLFNTDRHAGNILVRTPTGSTANLRAALEQPKYELIPIDHGFCLPEALENPYFEWQHWPQALLPFDDEELEYIRNLNVAADQELLQKELPNLRPECLRVLQVATTLLQKCASAGLSLAEIAAVVTRPFVGNDDDPSELEVICRYAADVVQDVDMNEENSSELESLCEEDEDEVIMLEMSPIGIQPVVGKRFTEEDMLFELEEEGRAAKQLVAASSLDSSASSAEHYSLSSDVSGNPYQALSPPGVAIDKETKPLMMARSVHATAGHALWRNVKGRHAATCVGTKKMLCGKNAPQAYPPPVIAKAPVTANGVFSSMDKAQWQMFMEVVKEQIDLALKSGSWKQGPVAPFAASCHY